MLSAESGSTALAAIVDIFDGDGAAIDEFLSTALHALEESLSRIERASAEMDRESLAQSAHRLKGAAATIGGTRVSAVSAAIECAAREGRAAAPSVLSECREAVAALKSDISNFRNAANPANGEKR